MNFSEFFGKSELGARALRMVRHRGKQKGWYGRVRSCELREWLARGSNGEDENKSEGDDIARSKVPIEGRVDSIRSSQFLDALNN